MENRGNVKLVILFHNHNASCLVGRSDLRSRTASGGQRRKKKGRKQCTLVGLIQLQSLRGFIGGGWTNAADGRKRDELSA